MTRDETVMLACAILASRRRRRKMHWLAVVTILAHSLTEQPVPRPRLSTREALGEPLSIARLPEHYFVPMFRIEKADFPRLQHYYGIPDHVSTRERVSCTAFDAIAVLLRRLAYPTRFFDLQFVFRRHKSALHSVFRWALLHVFEHCRRRVQCISRDFWTDDRLLSYCNAMLGKGSRYHRVFGAVDGTTLTMHGHTIPRNVVELC